MSRRPSHAEEARGSPNEGAHLPRARCPDEGQSPQWPSLHAQGTWSPRLLPDVRCTRPRRVHAGGQLRLRLRDLGNVVVLGWVQVAAPTTGAARPGTLVRRAGLLALVAVLARRTWVSRHGPSAPCRAMRSRAGRSICSWTSTLGCVLLRRRRPRRAGRRRHRAGHHRCGRRAQPRRPAAGGVSRSRRFWVAWSRTSSTVPSTGRSPTTCIRGGGPRSTCGRLHRGRRVGLCMAGRGAGVVEQASPSC